MADFIYCDDDLFVKHETDVQTTSVSYQMHTHEIYELYYFLGGNAVFWVEGNPYQLQVGDIVILNISEAHTIDVKPGQPYERVAINFSKNLLDSIDPDHVLQRPFCARELGKNNILHPRDFEGDFWKKCISKIIAPTDNRRMQTLCNLPALLNEIRIASKNKLRNAEYLDDSVAAKIISYINYNISEPLSIAEISNRFYISKSRLHTVFKAATGSSVWEYITVKRLMLAKRLLHIGEKPTQVYLKCGFNDYTVFFRAYKRRFGISPRDEMRL